MFSANFGWVGRFWGQRFSSCYLPLEKGVAFYWIILQGHCVSSLVEFVWAWRKKLKMRTVNRQTVNRWSEKLYFHKVVFISSLKRSRPSIWTNLNVCSKKIIFCQVKYGGLREEDETVKKYADKQHENRRSEKLPWTFKLKCFKTCTCICTSST